MSLNRSVVLLLLPPLPLANIEAHCHAVSLTLLLFYFPSSLAHVRVCNKVTGIY
jgi:hypothetical protein